MAGGGITEQWALTTVTLRHGSWMHKRDVRRPPAWSGVRPSQPQVFNDADYHRLQRVATELLQGQGKRR